MSKPTFVYVTYIAAPPEKVWQALTKADLSEQYWFGYRVEASGKPGDRMTAFNPAGVKAHDEPIIESDPPRRLVAQAPEPRGIEFTANCHRASPRSRLHVGLRSTVSKRRAP